MKIFVEQLQITGSKFMVTVFISPGPNSARTNPLMLFTGSATGAYR